MAAAYNNLIARLTVKATKIVASPFKELGANVLFILFCSLLLLLFQLICTFAFAVVLMPKQMFFQLCSKKLPSWVCMCVCVSAWSQMSLKWHVKGNKRDALRGCSSCFQVNSPWACFRLFVVCCNMQHGNGGSCNSQQPTANCQPPATSHLPFACTPRRRPTAFPALLNFWAIAQRNELHCHNANLTV